ncbi:MAG: arginine--tRNA ligase [Clostridia bacterium]|nr:arginine--tRNA ligase [Clostridia bacterium]
MEEIKIYVAQKLKEALNEKYNLELSYEEIFSMLESPKDKANGDIAFPCFRFAKDLHLSPNVIALEIKEELSAEDKIEKIQVIGAYINFYVSSGKITDDILGKIIEKGQEYGSTNIGNMRNVLIDYSSPNIAKPFHLGHLRTTIIGRALYNLYKELGYTPVGINYLGDWGRQFGLVIEGYKRFKDEYELEKDPLHSLSDMYARANNLAKDDEKVMDLARENFKKLEEGDEECLNLWKYFRDTSLKEYYRIYDLMGCKFDVYTGESEFSVSERTNEVIDMLNEKGVLTESQGAKVVNLSENEPPCIIIKSNESTTYALRDLASILWRARNYDYVKSIYVTSYEQIHHFNQIFRVAKYVVDEKYIEGLVHVPYGMVRLKTGKMSTREGTVIYLQDLIDDAIKKSMKILEEKNTDVEDKEKLAKQIGIGALVFNDLKHNKIKDVVFDLNEVLRFDGETGPYVQYMYARISSILKKASFDKNNIKDSSYEYNDVETEVIKLLGKLPNVIKEAAENYEPSILTRYIIDVASAFSTFYNSNTVLSEDENEKIARLKLVYGAGVVIKKGLNILGIETPEKM